MLWLNTDLRPRSRSIAWKDWAKMEREHNQCFFAKNIYAFMCFIMMVSGGRFLKRLFIYFSFRRPFRVLTVSQDLVGPVIERIFLYLQVASFYQFVRVRRRSWLVSKMLKRDESSMSIQGKEGENTEISLRFESSSQVNIRVSSQSQTWRHSLTLAPAGVWANLEPAGGGGWFQPPREISRTTQRIEKR